MDNITNFHIFIVEDDFVFTQILVNLIESINEEIANSHKKISYSTFYSVKEAAFELSQHPNIVLLDYFIMDDELQMDTGTKLLDAIKEHDPSIDVIVISGQEDPKVKQELLDKGAFAYLSKKEDALKSLKPLLIKIIMAK